MCCRFKLSSVSLKSKVSKCADWSRLILKSPISSRFLLSSVMFNSIRFARSLQKVSTYKFMDSCAVLSSYSLHSMISVL